MDRASRSLMGSRHDNAAAAAPSRSFSELAGAQQPANPRTLTLTVALVLMAAIAAGVLPAVRLGAGGSSLLSARGTSPAHRRLRAILVAAEVAVASMLIVTAVVLARSVARLQHVDPGVRVEGLLTARLSLPRGRYPHPAQAA